MLCFKDIDRGFVVLMTASSADGQMLISCSASWDGKMVYSQFSKYEIQSIKLQRLREVSPHLLIFNLFSQNDVFKNKKIAYKIDKKQYLMLALTISWRMHCAFANINNIIIILFFHLFWVFCRVFFCLLFFFLCFMFRYICVNCFPQFLFYILYFKKCSDIFDFLFRETCHKDTCTPIRI